MKRCLLTFLAIVFFTTVANAGTVTRGLNGEQDIHHYESVNSTFTRSSFTSATISLDSVGAEVDALMVYGGGVNYNDATIVSALTTIGTTNKVTLLFRPGTWTFSANRDWSAYTNVTFEFPVGAVISHSTHTLNIPNINAGLYQIFNGAGAVTLSGSVKEIYPEWWGINGTADDVAIQAALTAGQDKAPVHLLAKTYQITTKLAMPDRTTLRGVAGGYSSGGTIFNCVGAITCIETIDGGGPYYIEGIEITGGASGATAIHVAAHLTHVDEVNITDFTGDYGIKMDNVGVSAGGPDWSRLTNIQVIANSAGFPITAHPLKHAIHFGAGVISAHLDKFTILYTGVDVYGIINLNGARNVNISRGEIETGWISDSTDVYGILIVNSADISMRELYFEKNNHGIYLNGGAGTENYNISMDHVFIDGSYPGSGTSHWSKRGITIGSAYNINTSITNSRIGNVYGTGTDIVIGGNPQRISIKNTLTDDMVPNDGDVVAITPTTILAAGTEVAQTDISILSAIPTFPYRAKAIWGFVTLHTAGTRAALFPQPTGSTHGQITFQCPAGTSSYLVPFYLPLNGTGRTLSYFVTGVSASLDVAISGYSY